MRINRWQVIKYFCLDNMTNIGKDGQCGLGLEGNKRNSGVSN